MNVKFHILIIASLLLFGCTKSEVFDSKDGTDLIGFDTYIGRAAESKAASANVNTLKSDDYPGIGLYGFYTGAKKWDDTSTGVSNPSANLWQNEKLYWGIPEGQTVETWMYTNTRYWTNNLDWYSFVAYAPYADGTTIKVNNENDGTQSIKYTCAVEPVTVDGVTTNYLRPTTDLLYSQIINTNKVASVPLVFNHALSRLTVKASAETAEGAYTFHVKEISITGNFITSDDFTLATGKWKTNGTPASAKTTYTFYTNSEAAAASNALGTTVVDYGADSNYLMMIPVNFASNNAALTVKYTALYGGVESGLKTATLPISTNFVGGSAYAINIKFELSNAIEFSCDLDVSSDEDGNNDGWNNTELGIQ